MECFEECEDVSDACLVLERGCYEIALLAVSIFRSEVGIHIVLLHHTHRRQLLREHFSSLAKFLLDVVSMGVDVC